MSDKVSKEEQLKVRTELADSVSKFIATLKAGYTHREIINDICDIVWETTDGEYHVTPYGLL